MTYVLLYRSPKTGKIHPIVTDEAYGVREFDSRAAVEEYLEESDLLLHAKGVQVVELEI